MSDPLRVTDGLGQLIGDILRKYGGTMKGRGDHDIYDALVRFRAAIGTARPGLDECDWTYAPMLGFYCRTHNATSWVEPPTHHTEDRP